MNKKNIILVLGIFLIMFVVALQINTFSNNLTSENLTFIGNENITRNITIPYNALVTNATMNLSGNGNCYQETANKSVSCANKNFNGKYSTNFNGNMIDGNWSSYATVSHPNWVWYYYYVNYSNILHFDKVYWKVKDSTIENTIKIPDNCIKYNTKIELRIKAYSSGDFPYENLIEFDCYNGTWISLKNDNCTYCGSTFTKIYEDGIYWLNNSFPINSSIKINNTEIWNITGEFNATNNKTSDFSSILNNVLSLGSCNGGILNGTNCIISLLFHSDSSGILEYSDINITYISAPFITLESPLNNTWSSSKRTFNCSATDEIGLKNITFYFYNSTGKLNLSITKNITGLSNSTTYNMTFNSTEKYTWGCSAYNNNSRSWWSNSNYTINVDTTNPFVKIYSPTNKTYNTTNLQLNYTSSDTNLDKTWYNYNNINTTLTGNTTFTGLEGISTLTLFANDSAGNINSTNVTFTIDTTKPVINVYSPISKYYASSNITLNYTSSDTNLDKTWYNVEYQNGTNVISNTTLINNITFSVNGNGLYYLNIFANDSVNNLESKQIDFGVSLNGTIIQLLNPTDNKYLNYSNNISLNFSVNDILNTTCNLYTNFSGIWKINKTYFIQSNSIDIFKNISFNLNDNRYKWNVYCNDSLLFNTTALNNFTFIVDTINPKVKINSITTTAGTQTFSFNSNITDTNLDYCKYSIYNSTGQIDGLNNNITFTCNQIKQATTTSYGTYNLTIYGVDKSGNINSSTLEFTTSASVGAVVGGGGGSTIVIKDKGWKVEVANNISRLVIKMPKESRRTFEIKFLNTGEKTKTITLSCIDIKGKICKYVKFNNNSFELSPLKNTEQIKEFYIILPNNVTKGNYEFNILATDGDKREGTITVLLGIETSGLIFNFFSILLSSTPSGFPYSLIFFPTLIIGFFVFSKVFKKETAFRGFWIIITSLTISVVAVLLL